MESRLTPIKTFYTTILGRRSVRVEFGVRTSSLILFLYDAHDAAGSHVNSTLPRERRGRGRGISIIQGNHTLFLFLHDVSAAAGGHLVWTKDGYFYLPKPDTIFLKQKVTRLVSIVH